MDLINEKGTHELASKDIWDKVTEVPGEFMYRGNTKYETVDYGVLTQKLVINICKEVLGAKKGRDNSQRKWIFDKKKLNRLNELFNLSLEVKVTHQADVTHSGIDKIVLEPEDNQENDNIITKKIIILINQLIIDKILQFQLMLIHKSTLQMRLMCPMCHKRHRLNLPQATV